MSLSSSKILRLITSKVLADRQDVLRLMRWRIENQQYYASQPKITEASFRKWLVDRVFRRKRVLFWVIDGSGRKIGHMGWDKFNGVSCEIDNVLRGEKRGRGRMGEALEEIIHWIFHHLSVEKIYLRVLSTNIHAIEFYKRHKFVPLRLVLVKKGSPLRFLKMVYEYSHSQ